MATSFVVSSSRAGVGAVVVTESDTKTYVVSNVGVVTESNSSGVGGATPVRVIVMA